MILNIQICTIDEAITRIPSMLMPPQDDIRYTVSMQYTEERFLQMVPEELRLRSDVQLLHLEGRGLSRNRNHALNHTQGDIIVIADDDNRYTPEEIERIRTAYREHPEAHIILFEAEDYEGNPYQNYPKETMSYSEAMDKGVYAMSVGMTMRADCPVRFDERFGLGSPLQLVAGEEDLFMKAAKDRGLQVLFVPQVIVHTNGVVSTRNFSSNPRLQITKGAVFRQLFGVQNALWRTLKEGLWYTIHKHVSPFPIIYNMCKGIWKLR